MSREDSDWESAITIAGIVVTVILLAKIIFWISLGMIAIGIIGLFLNRDGSGDDNKILGIILIAGLIITPISHYIGYQFEHTDIGKPIVDSSKAILDADQQIKSVPEKVDEALDDALVDVVNESISRI